MNGPLAITNDALEQWIPRRPDAPVALAFCLRCKEAGSQVPIGDTVNAALVAGGANIVWGGESDQVLIGKNELPWHHVVIAQFTNHGAALAMFESPEYAHANESLQASVGASQIIAMRPQVLPRFLQTILGFLRLLSGVLNYAGAKVDTSSHYEFGGVHPTLEQIESVSGDNRTGSVAMINLLAYREQAQYTDPTRHPGSSGKAAYRRYGAVAARSVCLLGGRLVFLGSVQAHLKVEAGAISSGEWDEVAIVEYPSRQAFLSLVATPGYVPAMDHRTAGLERTVLVMTQPWEEHRLVSPTPTQAQTP